MRFPNFNKAWNYEQLSKVLKEHKIKNSGGHAVFSVSMESGIVNQIEHLGRSFSAADTSNYTVGRRFDVVYTRSPLKSFPFGIVKQNKFNDNVALSPLYGVFTPSSPHLGLLIEAYFELPSRSAAFLDPLCQKGAKNTLQITNDTFLSGRLPLPQEPAEQQKIADCLTSLDDLIAAQGDMVQALRAHKTGLMQQLFPRPERIENGTKHPAETTPRLRFPEFRDAGEWDKTTIGELGRFYYGKSAPKWSLSEDATTPCVRYGELYTKFGSVISQTYSKTSIDPKTLKFSNGGEILIPRVGEKPEDFGKSCAYLPLKGVAIGEMISVLETTQNPLFYTHYFRAMYRQFASVVEGQNVKNLYFAELEPLPIYRPSLPEQQRIADCLTSLDTLIAAQSEKLDALKTHKKGMMQQLFPVTKALP